jgi:DNA-directed RNA polymerase subunit RPC12/RpoP
VKGVEFACVRCGGRVIDGQCEICREVYITKCSRCGNTVSFEERELGGEVMLRCVRCDNDFDLQMVMWP